MKKEFRNMVTETKRADAEPIEIRKFASICGVTINPDASVDSFEDGIIRQYCRDLQKFVADPANVVPPDWPNRIPAGFMSLDDDIEKLLRDWEEANGTDEDDEGDSDKAELLKASCDEVMEAAFDRLDEGTATGSGFDRDRVRAELVEDLRGLRGKIRTWEAKVEKQKAELKTSRGTLDELTADLLQKLDELEALESGNYQRRLDFASDASGDPTAEAEPDSDEIETETPGGFANDGKRLDEIEVEIDGKSKRFKKPWLKGLAARDVETVGQLNELIRSNAWWHRDVDGIGQAAVDEITDILCEVNVFSG